MEKINWGIVGCGRISAGFAKGLRTLKGAGLTAAASLTPGKAETFARRFNIPKSYTDYESLVSDPDVDVVYIGTLHNAHKPNTLLALEHGKHVLCENPRPQRRGSGRHDRHSQGKETIPNGGDVDVIPSRFQEN